MTLFTENLSGKTLRWAAASAIALVGLLAYANSFTNEFVWDDTSSVLLNKHVQDPAFLGQLFREDQHPFGRGQGNFYRPLVAASFMIDYLASQAAPEDRAVEEKTARLSPFFFHVTNTFWHIAAALLLFALLNRLRAPDFARLAVPLLYVVHPLHTEAVTYISGRADPMSASFMFAGLWFACCDSSQAKRITGTLLAAACFIAALCCKESAAIFPFLVLLVVFTRPVEQSGRKQSWLPRLLPAGVSLIVLAAYAGLRMTKLHFASAATQQSPLGHRITETLQSFACYIKLIFVPTNLHMERTLAGVSGGVAVLGAVLLALCVGVLILAALRKRRRLALAVGWFLLTWLPISGLFPLNAPMAEHWLYVPLAGFLWAFAEVISPWLKRPAARKAALIVVWAACVAFLALTVSRNQDWRDNETIFRATLAQNPASIRVHYNLAVTYEDILHNLPGARRHYEAVIALYKEKKKAAPAASGAEVFWEDELESHLSLARIFLSQQRYAAAMEHYNTIMMIAGDPKYRLLLANAATGLGQCFLATGDVARAGECFKQALTLQPELKNEIQRALIQGAAKMKT